MIHNEAIRTILNAALLILAGWWGLRTGRSERTPVRLEVPTEGVGPSEGEERGR